MTVCAPARLWWAWIPAFAGMTELGGAGMTVGTQWAWSLRNGGFGGEAFGGLGLFCLWGTPLGFGGFSVVLRSPGGTLRYPFRLGLIYRCTPPD